MPDAGLARSATREPAGTVSLRDITRRQWLTLFAAQAGYMLELNER